MIEDFSYKSKVKCNLRMGYKDKKKNRIINS